MFVTNCVIYFSRNIIPKNKIIEWTMKQSKSNFVFKLKSNQFILLTFKIEKL